MKYLLLKILKVKISFEHFDHIDIETLKTVYTTTLERARYSSFLAAFKEHLRITAYSVEVMVLHANVFAIIVVFEEQLHQK